MKTRFALFALLVAAAGFVGGYGYQRWYGKKPETAAQPSHPPGGAQISPERLQTIGVRYATVEYTTDGETVRATGRVTVDETRITRVHAKTDGWIEQVFVNFIGQVVAQGQPLLTLYSPELLASQEEYLLALRAKETLRSSTVAGVQADADALIEAARRRLALRDLTGARFDELRRSGKPARSVTLYSPVAGYVTARNAFPSQRITPETDLYTVVDLSRVWVVASVFEYEAPLVRLGQSAVVSLPYQPGHSHRGRVSYIQPEVDAATRSLQVRLELANPGLALKPDMYVEVQLEAARRRVLTVPAEAVLDSGLEQRVFVDLGGGAFEPRRVETGRRAGDRLEILKGLAAGERVVTSGNFLISSESQLKAAAAGAGAHQHGTPAPAQTSGHGQHQPQSPPPAPPAASGHEHHHD